MTSHDRLLVIVVGAGLAGLTCARLAAGHLLLDPAGSAWDLVRELILSFVRA